MEKNDQMVLTNENIDLVPVHNLNELSGISKDYRNNYIVYKSWLSDFKIEGLRSFIRENNVHFKKYEEYFSPNEYKDIVTEKNKKAVEKIDELIDQLRDVTSKDKIGNLTEEVFLKICNAIDFEVLRPDLEDKNN